MNFCISLQYPEPFAYYIYTRDLPGDSQDYGQEQAKTLPMLPTPPGTQPSGKVAFFMISVLDGIFLEPQTKDSHLITR